MRPSRIYLWVAVFVRRAVSAISEARIILPEDSQVDTETLDELEKQAEICNQRAAEESPELSAATLVELRETFHHLNLWWSNPRQLDELADDWITGVERAEQLFDFDEISDYEHFLGAFTVRVLLASSLNDIVEIHCSLSDRFVGLPPLHSDIGILLEHLVHGELDGEILAMAKAATKASKHFLRIVKKCRDISSKEYYALVYGPADAEDDEDEDEVDERCSGLWKDIPYRDASERSNRFSKLRHIDHLLKELDSLSRSL